MQLMYYMTFHAACLFSGYVGSKFPSITTPVIKTKMAQKLKDSRTQVQSSAAKSLKSRLDAPPIRNADATESAEPAEPPLPMLPLDEL